MTIFAKADLWWVDNELFKNLRINKKGLNIAVIKVYLSLALKADFYTRKCSLSYSEIEDISGLSRPMVAKALLSLVENQIIKKSKFYRGKRNTYKLIEHNSGWAKIPSKVMLKELNNFSNKSPESLYALKNLLVILKYRDSKNDVAKVTHKKFIEKTGTPSNKIKTANEILISKGIISQIKVNNKNVTKIEPNIYSIKGLTDEKIFEAIELPK